MGGLMRARAVAIALSLLGAGSAAHGQTLSEALVRAYQGNPQLNAERARQRATDENVTQALAGYRPTLSLGLSAGLQGVRNLLPQGGGTQSANLQPWSTGATITQNLYNGNKTANQVRQAEAQVQGGREQLRGVE